MHKIKPSRNGEITLTFTIVGKSCSGPDLFFKNIFKRYSQKLKSSRKFLNLQFMSQDIIAYGCERRRSGEHAYPCTLARVFVGRILDNVRLINVRLIAQLPMFIIIRLCVFSWHTRHVTRQRRSVWSLSSPFAYS